MNEDEAFIRAIVDNPGDDTPRLVYADWLDDHNDPRGPYLRAEHEWATTHDPSERETLREMAKPLDPVWVARVSRPPVGVCCDHFQWSERGPNAHDSDVQAVESHTGVTLPSDFRGFLLNNDGAKLRGSPMDDDDREWFIYPIGKIQDSLASRWYRSADEASSEAVDWLGRLLPIGSGFEWIDYLVLGLSGREYGMICVIDSQVPLDTNYEWYLSGIKPHTTTFADFLSLLPQGF